MNEDSPRIVVDAGARRGLGTSTGGTGAEFGVGWFAVDLVAGRAYAIDLARASAGSPVKGPPMLGIYSGAGAIVADTRGRDFAYGSARQITFTPDETGTHYLAAEGVGHEALEIWDAGPRERNVPPANEDSEHEGAIDLDEPTLPGGRIHGADGAVEYCRYEPDEPGEAGFGLRRQESKAALIIEDADGNLFAATRNNRTSTTRFRDTLSPGRCYLRNQAHPAAKDTHPLP